VKVKCSLCSVTHDTNTHTGDKSTALWCPGCSTPPPPPLIPL
jgi:hypothetical protein